MEGAMVMRIFNFLFKPVKTESGESTYKFSLRAKILTLWIFAGIMLVAVVYFRHILPVFIWAAIFAYLFNPVVTFCTERIKTPRALWIIVLYIVLGILIFIALRSLIPLISNEITDLVSGSLDDPTTFLGRVASQKNLPLFGVSINWRNQVMLFSEWIKNQVPQQAIPIFFGTLSRIILLLVFFVVTFYFLLESDSYVDRVKRIIPDPYRKEIFALLEKINFTLGSYIRAQVVLMLIMSVVSFVVLFLLRVKFALMLSLMTGVLEVIPIAGPIIATVVATMVALFQVGTPYGMSNVTLAAMVLVAYFALRQLEDYFVIPNVVSRFVKVHPVTAILALMAGGTIGGILGLFLAIPTAAILKVFFEYIYQKLTEE